jgi:hypothetical protein
MMNEVESCAGQLTIAMSLLLLAAVVLGRWDCWTVEQSLSL